MISKRLHRIIKVQIKRLQRYVNRPWYIPLIALLAALDNLVIIIPNDGILISSSMLIPKRWVYFALSMAVGATLGALLLASLVEIHGLPRILTIYPGINETQAWIWSLHFLEKYGILFLFFIGISPLMQQPAIILASLAKISLSKLTFVIFLSRVLKFLAMAFVASHSPKLLTKLWGIKNELEDSNIKTQD